MGLHDDFDIYNKLSEAVCRVQYFAPKLECKSSKITKNYLSVA